uniref:Uncharacterized protein n=2 Tax=Paracidobacterium acidisoli TaxID=2303751 RepID=A0A372IQ90_9BACT
MPQHPSVTDEYIAQLDADFEAEAERVKAAPDWPETQKRMVTGTYAYRTALDRVEQGWARDEIERELGIRTVFGKLPNPVQVIGNRRLDEEDAS